MIKQISTRGALAATLVALATGPAVAQVADQAQTIYLPRASPLATVSQRLALTDVAVNYHRPAAGGRDLWGQVVPSAGTPVWRTGANENTVVSISTDVSIQGKPLSAGSYGLHSIPGKDAATDTWTIIFSKDSQAWGSFAYDPAHDALRVEATPRKAAHTENFEIRFENLETHTMNLVLAWGEVEVPVEIAVDLEATVLADVRQQLTGLTAFFWQGWNQAANFVLTGDLGDLDEAIGWTDRSIQAEERFENLSTKAALLRKKGDTAAAEEIMARAMEIGNAGQLHNYGRQLATQGDAKGALVVFEQNAKKHPETWFVGVGLARGYSAVGDFPNAVKGMTDAIDKAPEAQKAYLAGLLAQLKAGQDIN